MVPKPCASAPWDAAGTSQGTTGNVTFWRETQHLWESVKTTILSCLDLTTLWMKLLDIPFGLGLPWKNYWYSKSAVNQDSLGPPKSVHVMVPWDDFDWWQRSPLWGGDVRWGLTWNLVKIFAGLFQAVGTACAKAAGKIPCVWETERLVLPEHSKGWESDWTLDQGGSQKSVQGSVGHSKDGRILFPREHFHPESSARHSFLSSPGPLGPKASWPGLPTELLFFLEILSPRIKSFSRP